jgi:hypothetical protein
MIWGLLEIHHGTAQSSGVYSKKNTLGCTKSGF